MTTGAMIPAVAIIVKDVVRKQVGDRKQRERIHRFNGSLESRTVRGRDRERVRENRQTIFQKIVTQNTLFYNVCVQCTLLYKSFGGLTEVLSYFNAH